MKYATTAFFLLLNLFAQAQTKTWDGGAGTNNWEDANNWNPNGVPSILNDVEIDNDSVSISSNQSVKSILLESTHATLTDQAIFLQNGSTLSIFNSTSIGLELNDNARFWNEGNLIIAGATSSGLKLQSGTFENSANLGTIAISLCGEGLVNNGTFQNRNNAEMNIIDISGIGLDNGTSLSQFSNRGEINISEINIGVNNAGTLLNRGDLKIDNVSYIGMVTLNYFKNFSNGVVTLDSLDDEGVFASDDFINEGDLTIKTASKNGIEDTFYPLSLVNSGYIYISKTGENGIHMDTTGSVLLNEIGGEILIDSTTEAGIYSEEKILNEGEISVNYSGKEGIIFKPKSDDFENTITGTINIEDALLAGIKSFGDFINDGSIEIKNTATYGLHLINTIGSIRSLNNYGSIIIENANLDGIYQSAPLINHSSGLVNIYNDQSHGITSGNKLINNGTINIVDSESNGIQTNEGVYSDSLINNGLIKILNVDGNGIDHEGEIFVNGLGGEIIIDSTGEDGFHVNSKLVNYGTLSIQEALENGLDFDSENADSLFNYGSIVIENSGENGVEHFGDYFINALGGDIIVDSSGGNGFNVIRKFLNEGNIEITNSSYTGLDNQRAMDSLINSGQIFISNSGSAGASIGDSKLFWNDNTGIIEIDSSEEAGIAINSRFINDGEIMIYNSTEVGVELNGDTLTNNGEINIVNAENGIIHEGLFLFNGVSGIISIDSTDDEGLFIYDADLTNDGVLRISNAGTIGLINEESISGLINNGLIDITNSGQVGFQNIDGLVLNASNGEIVIDSTGIKGFENKGDLKNYGTLSISNTTEGGLYTESQSDSVINGGYISVFNSRGKGIVHNEGVIFNESQGEIVIDSSGTVGFVNLSYFMNEGGVSVYKSVAGGLHNADSLFNKGKITAVSNSVGITNDSFYMHNEDDGEIHIDSSVGYGFSNYARFINDGTLDIKGSYGISTNSASIDTVINNGKIAIEGSIKGLDNDADIFLNNSCGKLLIKGLIDTKGKVVNRGLLENVNNTSVYFISGGKFENEGTFFNPQIIQPTSADFINKGNIIYPIKGSFSEGIKEMNVATTGLSPTHAIPTTWWADEGLSVSAGTYDAIDSSFTPNAAGLATDTLWLELDNGTCSVILSMAVNQLVSCSTTENATFTGALSSDWHTSGNWDTGIVPDACTIVTIPASLSCTITTGRKARAYRIEAASGSVFDAELGVVLDVNPEN